MTNLPTRILVTDDDALALKATARLLTSAGYEVFTAANGEQTLKLAAEHHPGMMLLDVVLPDIEGAEICRRIKADAQTADIFIILLSGLRTSSDEQSQGMEGGADGYIARPIANRELLARIQAFIRIKSAEQKGKEYARHLEETAANNQRLMHELETHQIELEMQNDELQSSQAEVESLLQQYTDLYDFAPVGYFTLARDGAIQMVNLTGTYLLNVERGKLIKRRFGVFVSAQSLAAFNTFLERVFESERKETCEVSLQKDGHIPFCVHIEATRSKDGQECRAVMSDITESKRAEEALRESEEKLSLILQSMVDNVVILDAEGKIEYINHESPGLDSKEVLGSNWLMWLSDEDRQAARQSIQRMLDSGETTEIEYRAVGPKREMTWFRVKFTRMVNQKVLLIAMDITESKQAEEQIAFLAKFPAENPNPVLRIALDGILLYINQAGVNQLPEWQLQVGKPALPALRQAALQVIKGETAQAFDLEYGTRLYSFFAAPVIAAGYANLYGSDVTERKQAEEALALERNKLSAALENTDIGFVLCDGQGNNISMNAAALKFHGFASSAEMRQRLGEYAGDWELRYPDGRLMPLEEWPMTRAIRGDFVGNFETYLLNVQSGYRWVGSYTALPVRNSAGEATLIVMTILNITERKQAEGTLRESEERLAFVLEGSQLGYWDWNIETGKVQRNARWAEMLGYTLEEIEFTVIQWADLHHPDDSAAAQKSIQDCLEGRTQIHNVEYRMRTKGGQYKWILDCAKVVKRDAQGKPLRMSGTHTDITERKQTEEALQASEVQYRLLAEHMDDVIWLMDIKANKFTYVSPSVYKLRGYTPEEVLSQPVRESLTPESGELIQQTLMQALQFAQEGKEIPTIPIQIEQTCKDGTTVWTEAIANFIFDKNGFPAQVIGLSRDITERKQAEQALRENELKYRALFETAGDAILLFTEGSWVDCNAGALKVFGYTREQIIGAHPGRFSPPIQPDGRSSEEESIKKINLAYTVGPQVFEWEHCRADGTPFAAEVSLNRLDLNGKPYIQAIVRDVSERKLAEDAIRENERRLRKAQAVGRIGDWEIDMVKGQLFYSDEMFELLERDPALGAPEISDAANYLEPEKAEKMQQLIMRAMETGEGWETDVHVILPSKREVWHHEIGTVTKDSEGNVLKILGVAQDITERKLAEKALRESENRFVAMFQSSPVGIALTDILSAEIFDVNEAFAEIWGYSRNELIGRTVNGLSLWEYPEERKAALKDLMQMGSIKNYTLHAVKRSGERILVKFSAELINLAEKKYLLGNYEDITERKQAEDKIRFSGLELKEAQAIAHVGSWKWDVKSGEITWSDEMFHIFGIDRDSYTGRLGDVIAQVVHPDDLYLVLPSNAAALANEPIEYRIILPDKSIRHIWAKSGETIFSDKGNPIFLTGVAQDITERKQTVEEMRHRMAELETLYESGLALSQLLSPKEIGQKIIELLEQKMDWHHTVIRLYNSQDENLEMLAFSRHNLEDKDFNNQITQPGQGLTGWAVQNSQIIRSGDVNSDPRYTETYPGMYSGLYVPMRSDQSVIGVVSIESEKPNAFSEANERLVATLSNQAAIAIENARLTTGLEQRVKERTAEVQGLYDNAPTGYHSLDANGVIVMINQTELNWLGYTREETVGIKKFRDLFTPGSQRIFNEKFPRFKAQGWVKDLEFEVIRKDGSVFPVLLNATAIYDADGKYLYSRSTIFDITVRKHAEEAARKLSQAIEHSPVSVVITNRDGVIEYVNPAFCEVTGYTRDEALGQNPRIVKSGIHSLEFYQTMWATLTTGQPWRGELCNKRKNGELYWEYASISPVGNEHGETTHYVAVKEDVTERKKAEEALRESRDKLSAANVALEKAAHLKDEFLASMSHELRTPLTGILGLSEAMQLKAYGELNDKQKKALMTIEESGRHLLELINDILDLSKIEAGKLDMQFAPCSLADICQASLQLTRGMAGQKHQNVQFSLPTEPIIVNADARRIKQILVNLLGNAVKFTPNEGELGLEVRADKSEKNVKLTVWDKGIGIKPEDMPKLFMPFTQLDGSLAREYTGTGLGLSLVKRLTDKHNGEIKIESTFGEGSRFTIILPWSSQDTTPIAYGFAARTGPLTWPDRARVQSILIADDNETMLQMLADFLEARQYRVIKTRSGAELLERAAELHPRIMLVDIQMPGMDGLETIRRIRAHTDPLVAATPVIAVTALAMPGDRERCLLAGANDYMSKPVKLKELAHAIQKLLEDKQ